MEVIQLNGGESLRIADDGEGWQQVTWLLVGTDQAINIGLGRTREEALESARTTLQNALNVVDVAVVRGGNR